MSVDLYVAIPMVNWPTAAAVQQCLTTRAFPVQIKHFPALDRHSIKGDGILASIDGKDAYLEGSLAPASAMPSEIKNINQRLTKATFKERIRPSDALLTIRVGSPIETRAASYIISALIVCFDGFGFEPQGNSHGRDEFAQTLLQGADMLKGM